MKETKLHKRLTKEECSLRMMEFLDNIEVINEMTPSLNESFGNMSTFLNLLLGTYS